jgi:hypothetical protein
VGTGDDEAAARAWTEARALFEGLSDAGAVAELTALLAGVRAAPPCR